MPARTMAAAAVTSQTDRRLGPADRPVINVSWNDAQAYVKWLSKKTGKDYRLLSEAEREYVARAGTRNRRSGGVRRLPRSKRITMAIPPIMVAGKGEYRQKTLPVKSFQPNPWGLYQVHGNVYDWVEDCWHDNYNGAS